MKKKEIMGSGGVLMVFMLAAKGIGALFRIPLTNIVGAEGMGLYQMVYPFYALLLTVSSGGLPAAISKIVASKNDERASMRVLKVAVIALAIIGGVTALAVLILRKFIATVQGNSLAGVAYLGIAPAVLFVCVISVLRGYFQGRRNMVPSGISQMVEQVFKLVFGLFFASLMVKRGVEYGVLGALLGVSLSELFALGFLLVCLLYHKKDYDRRTRISLSKAIEAGEMAIPSIYLEQRAVEVIKSVFRIALPVTLSSLVLPLTQVIDSVLIVNLLSQSVPVTTATALFGLINGPIGSLINMPTVLTMSLGVSLLPKIAAATDKKAEYGASALKVAMTIALPCTVVFLFFSREILTVLYSRGLSDEQIEIGAHLLRIGSLSVTYIALIQVATSCLQAVDKAHLPAINLIIGAVIKVVLTVLLLQFGSITGAMVASVTCYAVTALLNFVQMKKHFPLGCEKKWLLALPVAVTVFGLAKLTYGGFNFRYGAVVAIFVAVVCYAVALLSMRLVKIKEFFA